MFGEERHSRESFAACVARIFLNIGVCLEVSSKIRTISERTMAEVALERLLARVCSNVSLKEPRSRKGFSTQVTFAGKGVCANMHFKGTS